MPRGARCCWPWCSCWRCIAVLPVCGLAPADSAGRAWRGAQLLLRVRAAAVASPHLAVGRALRISRGAHARGGAASRNEVLNRLVHLRDPGGRSDRGSAAFWDESQQALIVPVSRWGYLEPGRPVPEGRLLEAWRSDRATLVNQLEWVLPGGAPGSVYVVPIPCEVGSRGLCSSFYRRRAVRVGRPGAAACVLRRDGRAARQCGDEPASAGAHQPSWDIAAISWPPPTRSWKRFPIRCRTTSALHFVTSAALRSSCGSRAEPVRRPSAPLSAHHLRERGEDG